MNPPDRLWAVVASDGGLSSAHIIEAYATADAEWCEQSNPRTAFDVHEYRLHRPVNWRTGVPDAETRRRHGGLFALLLGDGSTLRECYLLLNGRWRWNGSGTGARIINPHVAEVLWCPENEMPRDGE